MNNSRLPCLAQKARGTRAVWYFIQSHICFFAQPNKVDKMRLEGKKFYVVCHQVLSSSAVQTCWLKHELLLITAKAPNGYIQNIYPSSLLFLRSWTVKIHCLRMQPIWAMQRTLKKKTQPFITTTFHSALEMWRHQWALESLLSMTGRQCRGGVVYSDLFVLFQSYLCSSNNCFFCIGQIIFDLKKIIILA